MLVPVGWFLSECRPWTTFDRSLIFVVSVVFFCMYWIYDVWDHLGYLGHGSAFSSACSALDSGWLPTRWRALASWQEFSLPQMILSLWMGGFGEEFVQWHSEHLGYDFIPTVLDREIVDYWVPVAASIHGYGISDSTSFAKTYHGSSRLRCKLNPSIPVVFL